MYTLKIKTFFDAAHQLPDSEDLVTKKCANLHGHTYGVIVELKDDFNDKHGMVIDFKAIKDLIDENLDHKFINDVFTAQGFNFPTTAENIARFISDKINALCKDYIDLTISVCEGFKGENTNWVIYHYE